MIPLWGSFTDTSTLLVGKRLRLCNIARPATLVQGGARISGDEVEIWICEAALPRTEEERAPAVRDLRVGQSVSESSEAADSERVDEGRFDGEGGTTNPSGRLGHQPTIAEALDLRGHKLTYSESP